MELTRNSIVDLFSENRQEHFQPIVQILDVKLLRSSRFQLVISDGEHFQQAVAVRDMIVICENNSVHAFQVVKLIDYFLNNVKGIDILFILNVEILCSLDFTIGSPERFDLINKQLVLQPESIPNEIQNVPIPKLSQQLDEIYMPIKALTALSAD